MYRSRVRGVGGFGSGTGFSLAFCIGSRVGFRV